MNTIAGPATTSLADVRDLDLVVPTPRGARRPPLNVLLLCDDRYPAGTTRGHIAAIKRNSRHRVHAFNPMTTDIALLDDLGAFDVLVVHYSILVVSEAHLPPRARQAVERFAGLKVQFIQDEYRWIDAVTAAIRALGIDVLFSSLRPQNVQRVYGPRLPGTKVLSNMPGYVSRELAARQAPPVAARSLHATYRSREVPFWLGRFARQKHEMAEKFPVYARRSGLKFDVSERESDRQYGEAWVRLTTSGKSVLGTEGGASIFDFTGEIEQRARRWLEQHPGAGFEEVHAAILAPHEGNVVHRVLTPRLFEAIALRTPLVLFPGEYSGIIRPSQHFLQLEEDFANWEEVAATLKDDGRLQLLADAAYRDVIASGRFSEERFIARFDTVLDLALAEKMPSLRTGGGVRFAKQVLFAAAGHATARLRQRTKAVYDSAQHACSQIRVRAAVRTRLRATWNAWRSKP